MKKNEPLSKIATKDVISVHVGQKVSDVRRIFKEQNIHHLPVLSGEKLVGLISAADMIKISFEAYGTDERSVDAVLDHSFTIEQIMQKDIITLQEHDSIRQAAEALSDGRFHGLPVVDGDGRLTGIVTSTDLIRFLLDQY